MLVKVELEEVVLTTVALTHVTFIESEPLDPELVGGGVVALLAAVVVNPVPLAAVVIVGVVVVLALVVWLLTLETNKKLTIRTTTALCAITLPSTI